MWKWEVRIFSLVPDQVDSYLEAASVLAEDGQSLTQNQAQNQVQQEVQVASEFAVDREEVRVEEARTLAVVH